MQRGCPALFSGFHPFSVLIHTSNAFFRAPRHIVRRNPAKRLFQMILEGFL
jgi:hypothetical protein